MSQISQQMVHEFEELPLDMQREVIDFMQFLKTRRQLQSAADGQRLLALLKEGRQQHLFADIQDPAP